MEYKLFSVVCELMKTGIWNVELFTYSHLYL